MRGLRAGTHLELKKKSTSRPTAFCHAPSPLAIGEEGVPAAGWCWAGPGGHAPRLSPGGCLLGLPEVGFCLLSVCLDVIPEIPRGGPGPPVTCSKTSGRACRAGGLPGTITACFPGGFPTQGSRYLNSDAWAGWAGSVIRAGILVRQPL